MTHDSGSLLFAFRVSSKNVYQRNWNQQTSSIVTQHEGHVHHTCTVLSYKKQSVRGGAARCDICFLFFSFFLLILFCLDCLFFFWVLFCFGWFGFACLVLFGLLGFVCFVYLLFLLDLVYFVSRVKLAFEGSFLRKDVWQGLLGCGMLSYFGQLPGSWQLAADWGHGTALKKLILCLFLYGGPLFSGLLQVCKWLLAEFPCPLCWRHSSSSAGWPRMWLEDVAEGRGCWDVPRNVACITYCIGCYWCCLMVEVSPRCCWRSRWGVTCNGFEVGVFAPLALVFFESVSCSKAFLYKGFLATGCFFFGGCFLPEPVCFWRRLRGSWRPLQSCSPQ